MIINSVEITNFRCYYGTNKITFNQDGKTTLIYGDSGFGKSSFLQFFRWMFYGDPDFGKDNDKPLYNLAAFKEIKPGKSLMVSGSIKFEHLGVKYELLKSVEYEYSINPNNARVGKQSFKLQHLVNDSWVDFTGDVPNKINTILPKGLSKYFLLDGERARDIVLNSKDLKNAIHQLFGIDAYANAINHFGTINKKSSVLGYYQSEMTSKMSAVFAGANKMSVAEMQEQIQDLYDLIELDKKERRELIEENNQLSARRDEIFKILGQANNKDSLDQLIKANSNAITANEEKIVKIRHDIGSLFYEWYPYIFLSRITSNSSTILREKNEAFANSYRNVFENLNKELLKEIIHKNVCVCGRELDEEAAKRINGIINVMPPDSYAYQFGQFISKSKRQIQIAHTKINEYESLVSAISDLEQKNSELERINNEKKEELKRLDSAKDLVDELDDIDNKIKANKNKISGLEGNIARQKQTYQIATSTVEKLTKNNKVSEEYNKKIKFLSEVLLALDQEKRQREAKVKTVLNSCVRDIFKKLTTQTELDADKIQFVNDDFSLRTTYLTGGQLAVDEYSYVIGIIKALQEFEMENNENPIIIDAPFAFTGNTQSEHIFKTLPSVSKQTILLTLDLNKIKNLLDDTSLYEFFVIKNESQEKAIIERGNVNDIKF